MKKGFLPPLAVLAAVLAFCLWNSAAMSAVSLRWRDQLQRAGILAQDENWSAGQADLQERNQDRSDYHTYLHNLTGHSTVDEAEILYRRCAAFAGIQEGGEFQVELAGLREQLRLLAEMERFSIRNVL